MAVGDFQDRTEKATPRKRSEARKKGLVAKSHEIASVAVLLAGFSMLYLFGSFIYGHIRFLMQECFSVVSSPSLGLTDFLALNYRMVQCFITMVAPVMIVVFVVAILSNLMQVGIILSWEPLIPKFSKLSPIKGMTRLFSKQLLMELFKSLAKLAIVGAVAYWTVKEEIDRLLSLGEMEVITITIYILKVIFKIFILASIVMIFLAVFDYAFQKWQFEQQLKMTKQEVKEEFKRTEGDPLVKSRIKRLQQEMARRSMMQKVPKE